MQIAEELRELSRNLWWCWHTDAMALFRDLDADLWRRVNHNPIAFLAEMPGEVFEARASELALESRINYAFHRLHEYLNRWRSWGDVHAGPLRAHRVAYFSAKFGIYYDRGEGRVPHGWAARMKHAVQSLAWRYNAGRMVMEYATKCYLPAVGLRP